MRTLSRNKQAVYYALYGTQADIVDANGNIVGTDVTYGSVNLLMANVSPARGDAELQQFGINEVFVESFIMTIAFLRKFIGLFYR